MIELLSKKGTQQETESVDFDVAKAFLDTYGVDIEDLGLPLVREGQFGDSHQYHRLFRNLRATPLETSDGKPAVRIQGTYLTRARCGYKHCLGGIWRPGEPTTYNIDFGIKL
jgi:hypothetical protein